MSDPVPAAAGTLRSGLAHRGIDLRLGWYRHRYLHFESRGAAQVLHVLPGLAVDRGAVRHLLAFAERGGRPHRRLGRLIRDRAPHVFTEPCPGPLVGPLRACDTRSARLDLLVRECAREGAWVRLNNNRSTLVSLRQDGHGIYGVSVHHRLFDRPEALPGIHALLVGADHGRRALRRAMQEVLDEQTDHRLRSEEVPILPGIGQVFDFQACLDELSSRYFPDLQRPSLRWMRNPGLRNLRSIHFGTYVGADGRRPTISLHPRLRRPWVALIFVESVIHHELCHHMLAKRERRREKPHGKRFRELERGYPHLELAKAWQRYNLDRLLSGRDDVGCRGVGYRGIGG